MNSHKHAQLMLQYAQDAMEGDKPWNGWQCRVPRSVDPRWESCGGNPVWSVDCEYRRKPKTYTVTLTEEQLKEVIMAASHVGWENEDFTGGVAALKNALGSEGK